MFREIANMGASLQIAGEKIFNDFDRARSEADFRTATSLPLFFLLTAVALLVWPANISISIITIVTGIVIHFRLRRLADHRAVEATSTVLAAVKADVVTPPSLQLIRNLPTRIDEYDLRTAPSQKCHSPSHDHVALLINVP